MALDAAGNFVFNPDPVDAPPVLFHAIRVPCACGRALADCTYTFFPSSVFVHGVCQECGPQSAIFAPEMKGQQEPMPGVIARRMARLTAELARTYGEDPQTVLAELFTYLAHAEDERRAS